MRSFVIGLLIVALVANASVMIEEAMPHKDDPEACAVEEDDNPHPVDSTWQVKGECARKKCLKRGGEFFVEVTGCPAQYAGPGCKLKEQDTTKPHPQCCFNIECDDKN